MEINERQLGNMISKSSLESNDIWMCLCQFSIFFDQQFLAKHRIVQIQHPADPPDSLAS